MEKIDEIDLAGWIRCILDPHFDERHVPKFKEKIVGLNGVLPQIPVGLPEKYAKEIRKIRNDILMEAGIREWTDAIRFSLHPYNWSGIWKVKKFYISDDNIINVWIDWGGYVKPEDTFDFKHQFTLYAKSIAPRLIETMKKVGLEVEVFIASDEYDPDNSEDRPYWIKL